MKHTMLVVLSAVVIASPLVQAEEKNPSLCASLRAEKESIQERQRKKSTQSLRDDHKKVVDRMHDNSCKG